MAARACTEARLTPKLSAIVIAIALQQHGGLSLGWFGPGPMDLHGYCRRARCSFQIGSTDSKPAHGQLWIGQLKAA